MQIISMLIVATNISESSKFFLFAPIVFGVLLGVLGIVNKVRNDKAIIFVAIGLAFLVAGIFMGGVSGQELSDILLQSNAGSFGSRMYQVGIVGVTMGSIVLVWNSILKH